MEVNERHYYYYNGKIGVARDAVWGLLCKKLQRTRGVDKGLIEYVQNVQNVTVDSISYAATRATFSGEVEVVYYYNVTETRGTGSYTGSIDTYNNTITISERTVNYKDEQTGVTRGSYFFTKKDEEFGAWGNEIADSDFSHSPTPRPLTNSIFADVKHNCGAYTLAAKASGKINTKVSKVTVLEQYGKFYCIPVYRAEVKYGGKVLYYYVNAITGDVLVDAKSAGAAIKVAANTTAALCSSLLGVLALVSIVLLVKMGGYFTSFLNVLYLLLLLIVPLVAILIICSERKELVKLVSTTSKFTRKIIICSLIVLLIVSPILLAQANVIDRSLLVNIQYSFKAAGELRYEFEKTGEGYAITDWSGKNDGKVELPASHNGLPVVKIDKKAFKNCKFLTELTVSASVVTIDDNAFEGCSSLTTVTFEQNSNLESINHEAFYLCKSLVSITLPDKLKTIRSYAFRDANFSSITLPKSVESVASYAFSSNANLKTVYVMRTSEEGITAISSQAFAYCPNDIKIYVPADSLSAYKRNSQLKDYIFPM